MKLPPIEIKHPTNGSPYWIIANQSAQTHEHAALHAYREGAYVMSKMVRGLVYKRDMQGLMQLLNATDKKSFYGETN